MEANQLLHIHRDAEQLAIGMYINHIRYHFHSPQSLSESE
jgi:hypothetical protein